MELSFANLHEAFGSNDMPIAQRRALLAEERSVLDSVMIEAKDMQKGLLSQTQIS